MNGQEAIDYIHGFQWERQAPGLDRIRALLHLLGDPQRGMKCVHVAGTNGKGTTSALIASVLEAAGYRVGLNTSPYLARFHERIRINGEMIADAELAELTERVRTAADTLEQHPTEFELITAIALLHFQKQGCQIAVLEVGLGGGLDASNAIDTPEVAVLTDMGMDHVRELGPTMADIAQAKAGIIKHGGSVVSCGGCQEADRVFAQTCQQQEAQLSEVDHSRLTVCKMDLDGTVFDFAPWQGLRICLAGEYQLRNAATAITAVEALRQKGWTISEEALRHGLEQARWPGRLEVLRREGPVILLDGAHNPHGVAAAAASLESLFPGQKPVFLVGVMADKDVAGMLEQLTPLAEAFVTLTPPSPRAMDAEALRQQLLPMGAPVCACVSAAEAVRTAVLAAGPDGVVCALGSLYMAADVRRAVEALAAQ